MSLDAFNREAGVRQGRIVPAGASPLAGSDVFCLGYDGVLHAEELVAGDFTEIAQTASFTAGTKLFRVNVIVRPPTEVPAGLAWVLALTIDSTVVASLTLEPGGKTRTRTLTANVSKVAAGTHTVTISLQLVSV